MDTLVSGLIDEATRARQHPIVLARVPGQPHGHLRRCRSREYRTPREDWSTVARRPLSDRGARDSCAASLRAETRALFLHAEIQHVELPESELKVVRDKRQRQLWLLLMRT